MDCPALADLSPEQRAAFFAFVDLVDGPAWHDPERLLALRHTWVIADAPEGVISSPAPR